MAAEEGSFGRRLRRLREAAGLTQEELAERAGLTAQGVGALERGERRRPYPQTVRALAAGLGLPAPARAALVGAVPGRVGGPLTPAPAPSPQVMAARSDQRHNLPSPLTSFVGRAQEHAEVRRLLVGGEGAPPVRLVTLTGAGGSGKTRLAVEVAADLQGAAAGAPGEVPSPQPAGQTFSDGVVVVGLAPITDPELVVTAIAQALDVRDEPGRPVLDAVAAFLRDRALLLVLDNFEHVLPAAPSVTDLLRRCPRLKVLATSRAALHVSGEHELPVPPLPVPPAGSGETGAAGASGGGAHVAAFAAVALFCERAAAADPGFRLTADNATTVAQICQRLDGLPLAIELAAGWVKVLPLSDLLSRLEHRLAFLTGGPRDLPSRQQTLRGTIEWSHNLLTPAEQALFRRLAVFQGGAPLEVIQAVCADPAGPGGAEVLAGVAALVDKNLLTCSDSPDGERRFTLLETIREFGLERLEASGEGEVVRERYAWRFVRMAEEAEPHLTSGRRGPWLRRLAAEQDNLRAALGWAVARDAAAPALRLLGALWPWYWLHFREGRRWTVAVLALPSAAAPTPARAKALFTAAVAAWGIGELDAVHALSEENVALSRALGDPRRLAYALFLLGSSGSSDRAQLEAIYGECLGAARESGDPWLVATAFLNYAMAAGRLGEAAVARAQAQEAAARYRALGDDWLGTIAAMWLGLALVQLGEAAAGRAQLDACLPIFRELRDRAWETVTLIGLGLAARRDGDAQRAAAAYAQALALCRDAGDAGNLPVCLEGLAAAAASQGRPAQAARLLGAAQAAQVPGTTPTLPGFEEALRLTTRTVEHALGASAFAAARAAGQALPPAATHEEALATASGPADDPTGRGRPGHPGGLSDREAEVLRLVAAGRSNREVAAALVVSVRTVEKHVANIYAKIGARGRAAAATFALRYGFLPPDAPLG